MGASRTDFKRREGSAAAGAGGQAVCLGLLVCLLERVALEEPLGVALDVVESCLRVARDLVDRGAVTRRCPQRLDTVDLRLDERGGLGGELLHLGLSGLLVLGEGLAGDLVYLLVPLR